MSTEDNIQEVQDILTNVEAILGKDMRDKLGAATVVSYEAIMASTRLILLSNGTQIEKEVLAATEKFSCSIMTATSYLLAESAGKDKKAMQGFLERIYKAITDGVSKNIREKE